MKQHNIWLTAPVVTQPLDTYFWTLSLFWLFLGSNFFVCKQRPNNHALAGNWRRKVSPALPRQTPRLQHNRSHINECLWEVQFILITYLWVTQAPNYRYWWIFASILDFPKSLSELVYSEAPLKLPLMYRGTRGSSAQLLCPQLPFLPQPHHEA